MIAARNDAYERVARRSDVRFVTMDDYRIFGEVGLRGLTPDGTERPGARDRNGLRNALFADLLVTTGLRLEEVPVDMADRAGGESKLRGKKAATFCTYALNPGKSLERLDSAVSRIGAEVIGGCALHRAKLHEHTEEFVARLVAATPATV